MNLFQTALFGAARPQKVQRFVDRYGTQPAGYPVTVPELTQRAAVMFEQSVKYALENIVHVFHVVPFF